MPIPSSTSTPTSVTYDAGGRIRVGQLTTLFDGKILNADSTLMFDTTGTGTGLFENNTYLMSVTAGQYLIKSSKDYFPYFSGKSQMVEVTFDNFSPQANVVKRVGYFSSNSTAPYDTAKDGFWLESSGGTVKIVVSNSGTETLSVSLDQWDGYNNLSDYDFDNFTVCLFDYLWLGGAVLRMFIKTERGFVLAHTFNYAGTAQGTFTKSPNHKLRYEIRSTGGAGSLRYICSQVSTEGSISESGKTVSVNTGSTAISLAAIGTTYPILAIRKKASRRDVHMKTIRTSAFASSANDILLITLQKNPTFSAPLSYTGVNNTALEYALGNGTITVTTPGHVLMSEIITTNTPLPDSTLELDFISTLGIDLDDVANELVLCGTPATATISTFGTFAIKEY